MAQQLPLTGHHSRVNASLKKANQTHLMTMPHMLQGCSCRWSGKDIGTPAHGAVACNPLLGGTVQTSGDYSLFRDPTSTPSTESAARRLGSLTHSTGTGQRGTRESPVPWLQVPDEPERLMNFFQCLL